MTISIRKFVGTNVKMTDWMPRISSLLTTLIMPFIGIIFFLFLWCRKNT
jgi:hypothetical protein